MVNFSITYLVNHGILVTLFQSHLLTFIPFSSPSQAVFDLSDFNVVYFIFIRITYSKFLDNLSCKSWDFGHFI
jgi:hypothetical protein